MGSNFNKRNNKIMYTNNDPILTNYNNTKTLSTPNTKTKNKLVNACSNESKKNNRHECYNTCKPSKCCIMPIGSKESCLQKNEDTCAYYFQYCYNVYYDVFDKNSNWFTTLTSQKK